MKMLVVSDTHGSTRMTRNILDTEKGITHLMHLGDGAKDAQLIKADYPHLYTCFIKGNNDHFCDFPDKIVMDFSGYTIFATHGHLYGVRQNIYGLLKEATKYKANLVLFGHTHLRFDGELNGIRFLNPSAYGAILIDNGSLHFL